METVALNNAICARLNAWFFDPLEGFMHWKYAAAKPRRPADAPVLVEQGAGDSTSLRYLPRRAQLSALMLLLLASGHLAFAATPASSQIYKWMDDRGVVNYGNQPPENRNAKELDTSAITLSIYEAPKPRQVAATAGSEVASLSKKIDKLERQLEAEQQARRDTAEADARANQLAYDQCVAERGADCNDLYRRTYPLAAFSMVGRRAHRFQTVSSFPMGVGSGHAKTFRASHPLLATRTRAVTFR